MKIGFVSLPSAGHLNPMTTLARRMRSRNHEVIFWGALDTESTVRSAGINFLPYAEKEHPLGSIPRILKPVAELHALAALEYFLKKVTPDLTKAALEYLPRKIAETGIDMLVIDAVFPFLQFVPMSLNIPYVQVWTGQPLDLSGLTPPYSFSWPNDTTPEARARNMEGVNVLRTFAAPTVEVAKAYCTKVGLAVDWTNPATFQSKLAVIAQLPKEFDFAGAPWPDQFHYTGPFHDHQGRERAPFAWQALSDKPLIYASMGTLVNGLEHVYKIILDVAGRLPEIQVVLSAGKNVRLDELRPIPSNTIVVSAAPQLELLKRAALCITHAGLNTTLESLAQGVPMVAIPIAFDQPGVSARIAHHGVGEFLNLEDLTAELLLQAIQTVLRCPRYREQARRFQEVIAQTRGLDLAAEIIEQGYKKHRAEALVEQQYRS